tara:strand:+ start:54869 stop:55030 length:162 start_codon:yes stop_codon:yes gene_type:complete
MIVVQVVFAVIVTAILLWILWESTLMIDQRRKNERAGTHDYYGNKIDQEEESK